MDQYTIKDKIEYYFIRFLILFLGLFPKKFIYKFTYFITILFFKLEKRRSTLTIKNLTLAFPQKNKDEIYNLAKESYISLSITIAEIIMMFNNQFNIDQMINDKDKILKTLKKYTKDKKNGVIIITAHFANWELAAQFLPKNGYPMTAIGRRGNNRLIENNLTTPFREKYGNTNVHKKKAILKLVKTLKSNGYAGLLIDQKMGGPSSVDVNFFNMKAGTTNAVAMLKLKFNPIILPIFAAREKNGKYSLITYEPVEYIANEVENENEKIQKITQKYNNILEDVIKKYPEQWFWMHNRWKLPK